MAEEIRGKTVAIVGGGPGGSATAVRLMKLSRERNLSLRVVLFEGKDFERQYNQCVGVLSPPIEEILWGGLGVELPFEIFKRQIYGYRLHAGGKEILLVGPPRVGATYAVRRVMFDRFLLSCAEKEGAEVPLPRVTGIDFPKGRRDRVFIYSDSGMLKADAVVGAFGLDEGMIDIFETATEGRYRRPRNVLGRGLEKILRGENQGGRNDDEPKPKKYDRRGCRLLESITPGEVQDAYEIYKGQLISTVSGALITANQFYIFPLPRRQAEIPAAIFGRVKICLPMDGLARDVHQIELAFPQVRDKPEAVILHPGDLDSRGFIQSFGIRVKIFGSEKDRADFKRHESRFAEAGFAFEYFDHSIDTLDSMVPEEDPLPWFHVIGSRWFADIPPTWQDKVRASLWKLCAQETLVINYHPR